LVTFYESEYLDLRNVKNLPKAVNPIAAALNIYATSVLAKRQETRQKESAKFRPSRLKLKPKQF